MSKLRIKVYCLLKTEWMFCDLKKFKTISDLTVKIKERYDIQNQNVNLFLDDAILPNQETIEILKWHPLKIQTHIVSHMKGLIKC